MKKEKERKIEEAFECFENTIMEAEQMEMSLEELYELGYITEEEYDAQAYYREQNEKLNG